MDGRGCREKGKRNDMKEKRKWRHVRREDGQKGMHTES
jgi:hypothetical protein